MTGAFLITFAQLEKTGSTGKVFIPLEILKFNSTFETRNRSLFFAPFPHFYLGVLFTSRSAEFQLNSKNAYISKCIHKCINMYERTPVVIRYFKDFS